MFSKHGQAGRRQCVGSRCHAAVPRSSYLIAALVRSARRSLCVRLWAGPSPWRLRRGAQGVAPRGPDGATEQGCALCGGMLPACARAGRRRRAGGLGAREPCFRSAWSVRRSGLQSDNGLCNASFIGRGTFLDTLTNPGLVLSLIWTQRGVGAG